jgi:hypothetical protein
LLAPAPTSSSSFYLWLVLAACGWSLPVTKGDKREIRFLNNHHLLTFLLIFYKMPPWVKLIFYCQLKGRP